MASQELTVTCHTIPVFLTPQTQIYGKNVLIIGEHYPSMLGSVYPTQTKVCRGLLRMHALYEATGRISLLTECRRCGMKYESGNLEWPNLEALIQDINRWIVAGGEGEHGSTVAHVWHKQLYNGDERAQFMPLLCIGNVNSGYKGEIPVFLGLCASPELLQHAFCASTMLLRKAFEISERQSTSMKRLAGYVAR